MNNSNKNWFDNQAGIVDFINKKNSVQTEALSIDGELKEKLLVVNQRIYSFADLYKQTGKDTFIEDISKLNKYRMYVQIQIAKMSRDGDDPFVGKLKEAKKKLHSLTQEVAQLKKILRKTANTKKNLDQMICNLQKGIENQKQKNLNIQISYQRNLKIFEAFKELIKVELGHAVYMQLITVACDSVDQSLGES